MKRSLNYLGYLTSGFILFNLIWFITAKLVHMKALPDPVTVYMSYAQAINNGIAGHMTASGFRVVAGLMISLLIALPVGIAMGYNRKINKLLGPLMYLSYPIPKLALIPVVMIFFGIGNAPKIIIIVLIVVFQLIISIRDAVLAIPKENYDVFVSLNATTWDKIRHITLPATVPAILSSLRISTGIAVSVLIVTENYGTYKGLGFYLIDSWLRADYVQMYFGIFVLSLMGLSIFIILDFAEKYLCRWKG